MFVSELLENDFDNASFCDNSMYVLPPKTKLNSSYYSNEIDITGICGKNYPIFNNAQRKISSNVDIPTYKGFSIADGYSIHHKKPGVLPDDKNESGNCDKNNLLRKVRNSSNNVRKIDDFSWKKILQTKSHINNNNHSNRKNVEEKCPNKTDESREKPIQRTQTFLGDTCHIPRTQSKTNKSKPGNDKSETSNLKNSSKNAKIADYMKHKRDNLKKAKMESILREEEKKNRVKEGLKQLSDKAKLQSKTVKPMGNHSRQIKKQKLEELNELSVSSSQTDNSSRRTIDEESSNESEHFCPSVKRQLAAWEPMTVGELQMHDLESRNYIKDAINTNRQTDNILNNIMKMSEKMKMFEMKMSDKLADQKRTGFSEPKQSMKSNPPHSTNRKAFSNYFYTNSSNEYDSETNTYSSDRKVLPENHKFKTGVKKEVTPLILANRARRKLSIDEKSDNEYDDSESDSESANLIDRLLEENRNRYDQAIETYQARMLPYHKSTHKPHVSDSRNGKNKLDITKILDKDSLTFMRTYLRCKNHHKIKIRKPFETDKDKSNISNPLSCVVDESRKSVQEQSVARQSRKDSSTSEILSDHPSVINERKKSISFAKSNDVESIRSSHELSESDVTMEKSVQKNLPHPGIMNNRTPYVNLNYPDSQSRLSPNSLERQLLVELHYYDSLQASMEQLLQSDRFQGVGFAQQETLSLAQILKSRQWKDSQENESNKNLQIFTEAIQNLNNIQNNNRQNKTSYLSSSSKSTRTQSFSNKSSTESEASEIEEEIVDFSKASESHYSNQVNNRPSSIPENRINKPEHYQRSNKPPIVSNNQKSESSIHTMIETDGHHSDVVSSSQEISTAISISKSSSSETSMRSSCDASVIETQSITTKSDTHTTEIETILNKDELSSVKSVPSNSNFGKSEKSEREISTARSYESEVKSKSNSYGVSKSTGSKTDSKSMTENSTTKHDLSVTNYSKDEFETNSENQKSSSESDVIYRVNCLENEKKKKEEVMNKLKEKLNIAQYRNKEKTLRNHIDYLDAQIKTLKEDLENPNLSTSVLIASPISSKPNKSRESKENVVLPTYNRKSSSSSSSTKDEVKSISVSIDSSTLTSEIVVDLPINDQTDNQKIEEAETPRSSKQIQFEDINEEYSASNRDSSDLKTPSEKSYLSKEDNVTKSKSDNFHILVLNKSKAEDQEDQLNDHEDLKVISARTIHSDISEIPFEEDLSDDEIEEILEKPAETTEKSKTNSDQDFYSEDFSEATSQKMSKSLNQSQSVINKISNNEEVFSYKSSESSQSSESTKSSESIKSSESTKSSESIPPAIPLRRKFAQNKEKIEPPKIENKVDVEQTIGSICDKLLTDLLGEILKENEIIAKTSSLLSDQDIDIQEEKDEEDHHVNLLDRLDDSQRASIGNLITWNDENVLPLVDLAVEQLFTARQTRTGSTRDAFSFCLERIPASFLEVNSDDEIRRIYSKWLVYQALDSNASKLGMSFISRKAIYHLVLEIMSNIYELDDEPNPSPWMQNSHNSVKNKKLVLWQGVNAPNNINQVSEIVRKQLISLKIVSDGSIVSSMAKSRQHLWCIKQTEDLVDRLLIDETFQEDWNWYCYDGAVQRTVYSMTDDIFDILFSDVFSDFFDR